MITPLPAQYLRAFSLRTVTAICALAVVVSCAAPGPNLDSLPPISNKVTPPAEYSAEATKILENFRAAGEAQNASGYRIAPGDDVTVSVFGREDLSGQHRVGPDGFITLPVVGNVKLGGLHRNAARDEAAKALAVAYADLAVTVGVDSYTAYSVVVLGSVGAPGEYQFGAVPNLLRAIGQANGLMADGNGLMPQRCAIIRGKETLLWIDLDQLLRDGDLSLNVDLIPGDVVHVTADTQRLIYVLGEVNRPGMYPLRNGLSAIDAIALAGGVTEDSDDDGIRVLRPSENQTEEFDYDEFMDGDFLQNRVLAQGDVIFVPRHTLAEVGWVFEKLAPLAQIFFFYEVGKD
jgi:polysaccharide export outer membrane protein